MVVTEGLGSSDTLKFRRAVLDLLAAVRTHSPTSRVGLMFTEGVERPKMLDVTTDAAELERIASSFYESGRAAPLLESLMAAAATLKDEPNERRVIAAITRRLPDRQLASTHPQTVVNALRDAGASLWAIDTPVFGAAFGIAEERVIQYATRQSGGKRILFPVLRLDLAFEELASLITSQYVVSYARQAAEVVETIRVGVRRPGVSVYAPGWTPPINGRSVAMID